MRTWLRCSQAFASSAISARFSLVDLKNVFTPAVTERRFGLGDLDWNAAGEGGPPTELAVVEAPPLEDESVYSVWRVETASTVASRKTCVKLALSRMMSSSSELFLNIEQGQHRYF